MTTCTPFFSYSKAFLDSKPICWSAERTINPKYVLHHLHCAQDLILFFLLLLSAQLHYTKSLNFSPIYFFLSQLLSEWSGRRRSKRTRPYHRKVKNKECVKEEGRLPYTVKWLQEIQEGENQEAVTLTTRNSLVTLRKQFPPGYGNGLQNAKSWEARVWWWSQDGEHRPNF